MADLRERVAFFRENCMEEKFKPNGLRGTYCFTDDLLALIAEMKKNPPANVKPQHGWSRFADLLTEALSPEGEKR